MISISPLRYPGGKVRFTSFISRAMLMSGENAKLFIEPFCGGSGAAIKLLESKVVSEIALNDYDQLVSSFWKIVFGKVPRAKEHIEWLLNKIETSEISIHEWKIQKSLIPRNVKEAAWKCLFLNRTSFNGIIYKSGPIGGWQQEKRKIDVRFNREKIYQRITELYNIRSQVRRVDGMNWRRFCNNFRNVNGSYIYLDPPYYNKAEQLYGCLFNQKKHRELRNYLTGLLTPWMLSYDDAVEVRKLYSDVEGIFGRVIDQTYSAHPVGGASFIGRELFFSNRNLPLLNLSKEHVGLSVVGCFREIPLETSGPLRTSFEELVAIGT